MYLPMSHLPDSTTGADLLEDAPHPTLGNHSNAAGHIIPSGCRYRSTTCVVPVSCQVISLTTILNILQR
jgi:hypothetical protein